MKSFLGGLAACLGLFCFFFAMLTLAAGLAGPFVAIPLGLALILGLFGFALASSAVEPPSRCAGKGLDNEPLRETGTAPASSPSCRSSGARRSLPAEGATPDSPHWLIDLRKQRNGRYVGLCTCGISQSGLLNRADADAWIGIHPLFIAEAESWEERA